MKKMTDRVKGVIGEGTVKKWANGGAFVRAPSGMVDQEVWIIPKGMIDKVSVSLNIQPVVVTAEADATKKTGRKP